MPDSPEELEQLLDEVEEREAKKTRALSLLLDERLRLTGHYLALSARMGSSRSYILSVNLDWISQNVLYARDLPVFKAHRKGEGGRISINDITVNELRQREPDYRRQISMALYLATKPNHKFPPLLVVAYQKWVDDPDSEKWGPDGRALEPSLVVNPLDANSFIVDLDVTSTQYYALDGQHRLMAIQGLKDLLAGRLTAKDRDGVPSPKKTVSREEVEADIEGSAGGLMPGGLGELMYEMVGVEVLPAVQSGETKLEALQRLRRVFVDVNEKARGLEKGDLILLDEDHGFRILARALMTGHPLFRAANKGEERVEFRRPNLSTKSQQYTTLPAIVEMAEGYLEPHYSHWTDPILEFRDAGLNRPSDDEILDAAKIMSDYLDEMTKLPSHKRMMQGSDVRKIREEEGNILFRPVAQVALAKAVASLMKSGATTLEMMFGKLAKQDGAGELCLTEPKQPWLGVLCDMVNKKIRRDKGAQNLCEGLLTYLMGGGLLDDARDELKEDFFRARRVVTDDPGDQEKAMNLSGEVVTLDKFDLPHPWQ